MHEVELDLAITTLRERSSERRDQRRRRRRTIGQGCLAIWHGLVFVLQCSEQGVSMARCWMDDTRDVRYAVFLVHQQAEKELWTAGQDEFFAGELDLGMGIRIGGRVQMEGYVGPYSAENVQGHHESKS